MRILSAIVQATALTVLNIGEKLALGYAIALQPVSDENARHVMKVLQETLEEALRGACIAASLRQNIEHNAVLIDCAPEIKLFTVNPNEDFVQVPFGAGFGSASAKIARKAHAKLQASQPDTLVGNKDASLRKKQLDISKAQAKYVVEPHRVADQLGRKTMAKMRVWRLPHFSILDQNRAARQSRLL